MAHRVFHDQSGTEWEAWDVHPRLHDRWTAELRSGEAGNSRLFVREALQQGWLCFRAGDERRRTSPIPAGWETLPERELARLCDRATIAPPAAWRLPD